MSASPPEVFSTAQETQTPGDHNPSTRTSRPSTPLHTPPEFPTPNAPVTESFHRPPKPLPYEIKNHARVYLEDGEYTQAFTLLTSLLNAGTAASTPARPLPAPVPPPAHLALAANLIVHPSLTTKATSAERRQASDAAFHYLRALLRVVGPVGADFHTAFQFASSPSLAHHYGRRVRGRAGGGGGAAAGGGSSDEEDLSGNTIRSNLATKSSVWVRGDDFWSVLGWGFACSVRYLARWERWELWIRFMVEVLEADWEERARQAQGRSPEEAADVMAGSLLAGYLWDAGAESRTARRRILRAILADGSDRCCAEFREVFRNETLGPKSEDRLTRLSEVRLNIDEGHFGDYDENESDDDEHDKPKAEESNGDVPMADAEPSPPSSSVTQPFGPPSSLHLRHRLLALLIRAAPFSPLPIHLTSSPPSLPTDTFTHAPDLLDTITEHLTPLPLAQYASFLHSIRPAALPADPALRARLATNLLLPLTAAPFHPATYATRFPTTAREWATDFLPHPARSASALAQAKVVLLLEQLLVAVVEMGGLVGVEGEGEVRREVEGLLEALRVGREARGRKVRFGSAGGRAEEVGVWERAEARVGALVGVLCARLCEAASKASRAAAAAAAADGATGVASTSELSSAMSEAQLQRMEEELGMGKRQSAPVAARSTSGLSSVMSERGLARMEEELGIGKRESAPAAASSTSGLSSAMSEAQLQRMEEELGIVKVEHAPATPSPPPPPPAAAAAGRRSGLRERKAPANDEGRERERSRPEVKKKIPLPIVDLTSSPEEAKVNSVLRRSPRKRSPRKRG